MLIDTELLLLISKAENGDYEAQYSIALAYSKGHGVPQSDIKALRYYKMLANNNTRPFEFVETGALYAIISSHYLVLKKYEFSKKWLELAYNYIIETYQADFANELIKELLLVEGFELLKNKIHLNNLRPTYFQSLSYFTN